MSEQLTDWFPASVKPVRPWVYGVDGHLFSHFDGIKFGWVSLNKEDAQEMRGCRTFYVVSKWRGLAANTRTEDSQTDDHTGICEVTE